MTENGPPRHGEESLRFRRLEVGLLATHATLIATEVALKLL